MYYLTNISNCFQIVFQATKDLSLITLALKKELKNKNDYESSLKKELAQKSKKIAELKSTLESQSRELKILTDANQVRFLFIQTERIFLLKRFLNCHSFFFIKSQ